MIKRKRQRYNFLGLVNNSYFGLTATTVFKIKNSLFISNFYNNKMPILKLYFCSFVK